MYKTIKFPNGGTLLLFEHNLTNKPMEQYILKWTIDIHKQGDIFEPFDNSVNLFFNKSLEKRESALVARENSKLLGRNWILYSTAFEAIQPRTKFEQWVNVYQNEKGKTVLGTNMFNSYIAAKSGERQRKKTDLTYIETICLEEKV